MVVKGFSRPVFGKYNYDAVAEKVTYTDGFANPHGIEYTAALEATEGNPLYGNNQIIENDVPRFNQGTLTLGVDGFDTVTSKYLLGIKTATFSMGGEDTVEEEVYDDDQKIPSLGVGMIELHQDNNEDHYRAVIFTKVTFSLPEQAAKTREGSIEWQTKTIEGAITRSEHKDENYRHPWQIAAWFDTEDKALAYLKKKLGVKDTGEV